MWPNAVKDQALASCGRRCCICHKFCGGNIELHHIQAEADDGKSTLENCIPLCFNCHADVGHYNVRHPKGTKYRANELRIHRDEWFKAMAGVARLRQIPDKQAPALPDEIYEGQYLQFKGYLSRQTFTGAPNYEDYRTDELETYWLLTLPETFRLSCEPIESTTLERVTIPEVQVLHLILTKEQYLAHTDKLNSSVSVTGRIWPCVNGHHRDDALIEVDRME